MEILLKNDNQGVQDAYDAHPWFNQYDELRMLAEAREKFWLDYNSDVQEARREGEVRGLLRILTKRFQTVPESLSPRILTITDSAHLDKLIDFAIDCESLEAFSEELSRWEVRSDFPGKTLGQYRWPPRTH